ncbi:PASTA domain-containing protein [Blastococcus sp. SYSU DS0669]
MATSTKDLAQALRDASAYPLQVSDALAGGGRGEAGDDLDRLVDGALRAVIGTRTRVEDVDRFRAALASSFVEEEVDGHRRYVPAAPGLVLQRADDAAVTGAQAVLLTQARDVVDRGLPLLGRITSLRPAGDQQDHEALAVVIRTAVQQLRDEFGRADGPRAPLVEQQLRVLLGSTADGTALVDPDEVRGALGALRDLSGLASRPILPLAGRNGQVGNRANTPVEEESLTHFRVLTEYVLRLWQSWHTYARSLDGDGGGYSFIGGRLGHLDLTFQTIGEAVDRVRDALDSVYVGPAERQILVLPLPSRPRDRLSVEQLLDWAEQAVGRQTANLARDHGRIALAEYVLPNAAAVAALLREASEAQVGGGFDTPRVRSALAELVTQYDQLVDELKLLVPPLGQTPGSRRTEFTTVPDVIDRSLDEANEMLRRSRLRLRLGEGRAVRSGALDRVLGTSPPVGTEVARGSEVVVDYAAGLAQTAVPCTRDTTVTEAERRLRDAGLRLGGLQPVDDPEIAFGRVVDSDPGEGTVLPVDEKVCLRVSSGDGSGDLVDQLCAIAPAVGDAVRQVLGAGGQLWRTASGSDDDCPDDIRQAVAAVGSVVTLLRRLAPARQGASSSGDPVFDRGDALDLAALRIRQVVAEFQRQAAENRAKEAAVERPAEAAPGDQHGYAYGAVPLLDEDPFAAWRSRAASADDDHDDHDADGDATGADDDGRSRSDQDDPGKE